MRPSVTRASSMPRKPEIARSVVVLPAPLVPRRATTCPRATRRDTPCTAVTTRWYATSSCSTASSGSAVLTGSPGTGALAEGPEQEVVLYPPPDPHQALRLVEQEEDHHETEGRVVHREDRGRPRLRRRQHGHQPLDRVREERHEHGAEHGPEHRAHAADDDHGDVLDGEE